MTSKPIKDSSSDLLSEEAGKANAELISRSPLQIPDPASLAELFAKDPLELTSAEEDSIIDYYRQNTRLWEQEKAAAKASGRRPNYAKQAKASKIPLAQARAAAKAESLDDLDL